MSENPVGLISKYLELMEENDVLRDKLNDLRIRLTLKTMECDELRRFYLNGGENNG